MEQTLLHSTEALLRHLEGIGGRIFLVCGKSAHQLAVCGEVLRRFPVTEFSDFHPNPEFESVRRGIAALRGQNCSCILAIGGGSALDVAKGIRLYAGAREDFTAGSEPVPFAGPLIAVPTTAGSGSETTRFAVLYEQGAKMSLTHEKTLPDAAALLPEVLYTLPPLQRRATVLDTVCHAVESAWSRRATPESRALAMAALEAVEPHYAAYCAGGNDHAAQMQHGAWLAGRAINLTTTTAGHAMAYKLTTRYGLPHGWAAAICTLEVWRWMLAQPDRWQASGLEETLRMLAERLGAAETAGGAEAFARHTEAMALPRREIPETDAAELARTVNPQRLANFPLPLTGADLEELYRNVIRHQGRREGASA